MRQKFILGSEVSSYVHHFLLHASIVLCGESYITLAFILYLGNNHQWDNIFTCKYAKGYI